MSYFRRGMGDGPITSPSQVDEQTTIPEEVTPTRVDCEQLPSDSVWRRPGQVCAPPSGGGVMDYLLNTIRSAIGNPPAPTPPVVPPPASMPSLPASDSSSTTTLLVLAGAALGGYYLFSKKKRR